MQVHSCMNPTVLVMKVSMHRMTPINPQTHLLFGQASSLGYLRKIAIANWYIRTALSRLPEDPFPDFCDQTERGGVR